MKLTLAAFALLFFTSFTLAAKSRLGEYYLGFGYSVIDGGKTVDLEGDAFQITANSIASRFCSNPTLKRLGLNACDLSTNA